MTNDEQETALTQQIRRAVDEYATGQADRYGFTALDIAIAQLNAENAASKRVLVKVLIPLIDEFWNGTEQQCEAVRDIVSHLNLSSAELAARLLHALDSTPGPSLRGRFYFWTAFLAVGGELSPRSLESEKELRQELPSLWLDLATHVYVSAPERLAALYVDAIKCHRINLVDVRRRLPLFVRVFGRSFPARMKDILAALSPGERMELAVVADRYQPYDLTGWLKAAQTDQTPFHKKAPYAAFVDFEEYMGVQPQSRFKSEGVGEFLSLPRTGTNG